jgi:hypothetical protein
MVDLESRLNSFRVNRLNRLDLPTPESPIRTTGYMNQYVGRFVEASGLDGKGYDVDGEWLINHL